MFITLTRGYYRHSEPAGKNQPVVIRLTDIEFIEEIQRERWVGEEQTHHVGTAVYLTSCRSNNGLREYTGDTYGAIYVREDVETIQRAIAAALPTEQHITEHAATGMVRVGGRIDSYSQIDVNNRVHHSIEALNG